MEEATTIAPKVAEKFVPTAEGLFCAYSSLMIMALVPIFVGSFKSIRHQAKTREHHQRTGEAAETMTDRDAAMFPVIASCALVGFYVLIKLAPELFNLALTGYFFLLGVYAISRLISPVTNLVFPKRYNQTQYTLLFMSKNLEPAKKDDDDNDHDRSGNVSPSSSNNNSEDIDLSHDDMMVNSRFTHSDILALALATLFGTWYLFTKHWVANNVFGLAFALNGVELLPLNSAKIGCILLCGLFFYDIFWVFGTNVMVTVAKGFEAPIKIMFPQDFLEKGFWGSQQAMLGLGDIVIPGIFIAFLLRFDQTLKRGRNTYFWSCFLAYVFGLALTIGVMTYFKHAQPALLYLVPACILTPCTVALIKGDLGAMFSYRDHPLPAEEGDTANSPSPDQSANKEQEDKEKPARSINLRARSKKST